MIHLGAERYPTPLRVTVEYSTKRVDELLSKRDYNKILNDQQLFLIAFFKASILANIKETTSYKLFSHDEQISVSCLDPVVQELPNTFELIRRYLLEGYTAKQDIHLVPIEIGILNIYLEKQSEIADLRNWLGRSKQAFYKTDFRCAIRDTFPELCSMLGARCSFEPITQKYKTNEPGEINEQNTEVMHIEWNRGVHLTYQISPQNIPLRNIESEAKRMHEMYQNEICCDLVIAISKAKIPVHSTRFYLYGGNAFKAMLTSNMKEQQEKTIEITAFDEKTVRAFIDFVYLGPEGLDPTTDSCQELDVVELFKMAQTYQVEDLITHCTNLLSLFASPDQAETISELAVLYENDLLKKLSEHLKS